MLTFINITIFDPQSTSYFLKNFVVKIHITYTYLTIFNCTVQLSYIIKG